MTRRLTEPAWGVITLPALEAGVLTRDEDADDATQATSTAVPR
jgi:hypothetical protein